jgi:hypothetical protein
MNDCWVDAINQFEAGKIDLFAMIHSDIKILTPDWIDILVKILVEKNADLVSVQSPLKDFTGVTSTAIGHQEYRYGSFKRLTIAEIKKLPSVFNNVDVGYPDQPILHNTACFICDLSNPKFHLTNPDGSFQTIFRFDEKIVRDNNGQWQRIQESEDWHFSRIIWNNGIRNTYVTSNINLIHYGTVGFENFNENYGTSKHGDDVSAPAWRTSLLNNLERISFELGSKCNLAHLHPECPNLDPERYKYLNTEQALTDDAIILATYHAYHNYGFNGLISWIYYNEPLLQQDRMFNLMGRIQKVVPQAKFLLWTNGTLIPENCEHFRAFDQIIVTEYDAASTRGINYLLAKNINVGVIENPKFDDRLYNIGLKTPEPTHPCHVPLKELNIDNYGNGHICCYDWKGEVNLGNLFTDGFSIIAQNWHKTIQAVTGQKMLDNAPELCKMCSHKRHIGGPENKYIIERSNNTKLVLFDEHGNKSETYPLKGQLQ